MADIDYRYLDLLTMIATGLLMAIIVAFYICLTLEEIRASRAEHCGRLISHERPSSRWR